MGKPNVYNDRVTSDLELTSSDFLEARLFAICSVALSLLFCGLPVGVYSSDAHFLREIPKSPTLSIVNIILLGNR